jgi:hypothetical protein
VAEEEDSEEVAAVVNQVLRYGEQAMAGAEVGAVNNQKKLSCQTKLFASEQQNSRNSTVPG